MKKAIILLICIVISFSFLSTAVADEEQYLKITQENVDFLRPISKDTLFTLTPGVYVKYITSQGAYYKVEYCGVQGLVLATSITDTDTYSNLSQYYHNPITVHFTDKAVSDGNNYIRYTSNPPTPYPNLDSLPTSAELNLIGKYNDGVNDFLYVGYLAQDQNVYYGFVQKADTDWNESASPILAPVVNSGNTTITPPPSDNNQPSDPTVEPTNNLVRVILIIGICIPAFLIVYLIFKPVKPASVENNPKRRQMDYEDFE